MSKFSKGLIWYVQSFDIVTWNHHLLILYWITGNWGARESQDKFHNVLSLFNFVLDYIQSCPGEEQCWDSWQEHFH